MAQDDAPRTPGFRPAPPDPGGSAPVDDDVRSRDIRRRMVVEATPEEVWRALTDPEELAAWWGGGSQLDATPGGEGRFEEDDEPVRLARVVETKPDRRLVLDWWPEDPEVDEPATRVTIELVPCPFGTIVTVVECILLDLSELPVLVTPRPTFLPPSWGRGPQARMLVGV
ncbi:MAG TPA: SRPBCC domain-containing protein [Acidimicrobiales bacterium]